MRRATSITIYCLQSEILGLMLKINCSKKFCKVVKTWCKSPVKFSRIRWFKPKHTRQRHPGRIAMPTSLFSHSTTYMSSNNKNKITRWRHLRLKSLSLITITTRTIKIMSKSRSKKQSIQDNSIQNERSAPIIVFFQKILTSQQKYRVKKKGRATG